MPGIGRFSGGVCRSDRSYRRANRERKQRLPGWAWMYSVALMVVSAACAGGSPGPATPLTTSAGLPTAVPSADYSYIMPGAELAASQAGFALYLAPDSPTSAEQLGEIKLSVEPEGQELLVTVSTSGARDVRGICAELAYASASFSPVSARCGALLGAADGQLNLCRLDDPGVVSLGAVLKDYDNHAGVSGAGELAQVRFARRPFTAARRVSSAPVWDEAKARLALDVTNVRLEWECYMPGDYNMDWDVNISDFTPIGRDYGDATMTEPFSYPDPRARLFSYDRLSCVDASRNGIIEMHDYYYLGYHWGEHIEEFRIYHSPDPAADMPDSNPATSKLTHCARVYKASRILDPVTRRYYFSIPLPDPTPGDAYWIRPCDGVNEGTPSMYAWYKAELKDAIQLQVEPVTYVYGGTADFRQATYTQGEDILSAVWAEDVEELSSFSLDLRFDPEQLDCLVQSIILTAIPALPNNGYIAEAYGLVNYSSCGNTPPNNVPFSGSRYDFGISQFTAAIQQCITNEPTYGLYTASFLEKPVSIVFDPISSELTFWYSQRGDTNQDGEVMFDDLILIGFHFGESGPFPDTGAMLLTDTVHDDHINIEDPTVIGTNIYSQTTGYFVYAATDPDEVPVLDDYAHGAPAVAPIAYVPFSAALGNPMVDRLHFTLNVGPQPSGTYLWVMPEFNGQIGWTSMGEYVPVP